MTAPATPVAADSGAEPSDARKWRAFRLKGNIAGAVILLAFVVGWWNGYATTRRLALGVEHVEGTRNVINSILRASMLLHAAATAHRHFLLSAEDEHLRTYRANVAGFRAELAGLRQLLSDRPAEVALLDSIGEVLAAHVVSLDLAADTLRSWGPDAARARVAESIGLKRDQQIDRLLGELEQAEMQLAAARVQDATSRVRTAAAVLAANALFDVLFIAGAFLVFNREISRQQRDDQTLRRAVRAADAANEAKTRFLATVSHEIRTPLNAVSGMSELLLDTRLDGDQREFAEAVRINAEALSMLIGDLLDSSRIEAHQVFLDSAPFDLRELVEGVADILVVRAEIKGVELIVDLFPDVPRQLVGDRNRLRQVLMNVVGNAVKFTDHGEVVVRVRSEASADGRLATLRMAVVDTGIGIAPEVQGAIFERFVQGSRSTVQEYGGTGLGLNISRSLMHLMGGRISLQSELGGGSTFDVEITLPIAPSQPPSELGNGSIAGVDVLVVHANQSQREAIVRQLQFGGASVRAVDTAAAAHGHTDPGGGARVIVVGERLSDSTGLDVARRIWRDQNGRATPGASIVLLCSLRAVAASYVGRYGIDGCVFQPVKQARLIQAVRHAAGLEVEPLEPVVAEPARAVGHQRILLVEDNPVNSTLATRVLASAGYEVDLVGDGVKAIESAAAFRYDLILMDIALPLIDGIEATRRIRSNEREAGRPRVPIVALTAHAVESVREQALGAGMDDYATKPIQKTQLLEICSRRVDPRPVLLIADDSPDIHVLLANYLGRDYRLVSVYNGRQAMDAFERQRFSLVLLDIGMPVMNGYQTARAIRRADGGAGIPIVALTGFDGPDERQESLAAGCSAHLSKPVSRADLLTLVAGLLGEPVSARHERSAGLARPAQNASGPDDVGTGAALPSSRDTAAQARRLLALRDFEGLAALAEGLKTTAGRLQLSKLATVSEELANAARFKDAQRAAWWGDELASTLGEAQRVLDVRQTARATVGGSYDSLAHIATVLMGVPLAAITLQDDDRVHIQGQAGLPFLGATPVLPLSPSFTQLVIEQKGPVLVEDARVDARLQEMIAIRAYGVVSLAAVPLISSGGLTLGAFGVMDRRPHQWPPEELAMLEELANVAVRMFEIERRIEEAAAKPPETVAAQPSEQPPSAPPTLVTVDDDIADLVPGYLAARRADVSALRHLVDESDFRGIGRLGHKMAGSGAGYGLPEVSRIGRDLERVAGRQDAESARQLIEQLGEHLSRVSIRSAGGGVAMEG